MKVKYYEILETDWYGFCKTICYVETKEVAIAICQNHHRYFYQEIETEIQECEE
jgi:hypothetical protein